MDDVYKCMTVVIAPEAVEQDGKTETIEVEQPVVLSFEKAVEPIAALDDEYLFEPLKTFSTAPTGTDQQSNSAAATPTTLVEPKKPINWVLLALLVALIIFLITKE